MKKQSVGKIMLYILPTLFIGLGSWAYTEAAGTTITVCAQKDGDMRLIGIGFTSAACNNKETLVSWNIQGPKGDTGAQGIQGVKGDKGDVGLQGIQGLKGDAGLTGATGTPGIAGKDGAKGDQGEKGESGATTSISTQIVTGTPFVVVQLSSQGNAFATATCPPGKSVLGGGASYITSHPAYGIAMTQSFPSSVDTWQANVEFFNAGSGTLTLTAYAICGL